MGAHNLNSPGKKVEELRRDQAVSLHSKMLAEPIRNGMSNSSVSGMLYISVSECAPIHFEIRHVLTVLKQSIIACVSDP